MVDYKRMVSYMYQYDNGVKRKNVGFVKVEAKGGQCKITLHMQLLGQSDSIFPTYLIQREENDMDLIYLGDTMLKNQVMDSRLSADETNIMGSGYGLSDMGGLLIFLNDNVFFATEWDDKPIVVGEVLEALKPKNNNPIASIVPEDPPEIFGTSNTIPAEENSEINYKIFEAESIFTTKGMPEKTIEEELKIPRYKLPGGWKMVERLQKPDTSDDLGRAKNEKEMIDFQEPSQAINFASETMNQENHTIQNVDGMEENKMDYSQSCSEEDNNLPDHSTAKRFFDNYPRIYPFEDNEIILCVKIEPKDIGLLPKELWTISNNSFLMHGYYCYHHLIFAKMKNRFGCRYIIGIPGIYHSREQFMARMFGFESFKSIRKRELRQGDFGYWYLPVNF